MPNVIRTENILIRPQYLNPVGYSAEKTFKGIAHPPRLARSFIFLFFKVSAESLNLKEENNRVEIALQILLRVVSEPCINLFVLVGPLI